MSADSFSQFAAYRNGVPFDRIRRYPVATATAAIAASLLAPVVSPTAVDGLGTASADCPDIEVVFGRGTTEGSGLGRFVESLRSKVGGRSVGAYAVDYAASYDFLAASGANDASAHIQHMIGAGPTTRLVLGGYSQGAAVMDVIAAVPIPVIGFDNPLPPNIPHFVAGIAVFDNPSAKLGLPLTTSPVWGGRTIDLCNVGDPVCQTDGESIPAHSAYTGGPTTAAANLIAGLL
jgi:cutinase